MEVDIEHFGIENGAARLAHEYGDVLMAGEEKDDAMAVFDEKDEICGRLQTCFPSRQKQKLFDRLFNEPKLLW